MSVSYKHSMSLSINSCYILFWLFTKAVSQGYSNTALITKPDLVCARVCELCVCVYVIKRNSSQ